MKKLPTMVYRFPGSSALGYKHDGDLYDHKVVDQYAEEGDESELDAALEDGWFASPAEAKAAAQAGQDEDDEDPPTIEELKQKADELGIEYTWNIKPETLLERINEALAEQGA
jgi:hypothetical protein